MTRKKLKNFVSCALCVIAFVCFAASFKTTGKVHALTISEAYSQENLPLNASFNLPVRDYTLGNETKTAKTTVISPSGLVYGNKTVVLNEVGEWKVRFSVDFDKRYTETYKFSVYRSLFEVSGDVGSVNYGKTKTFADKDTLNVTVPKGQRFVCNKVIDLSNLTRRDTLIRLGMNPKATGTGETTRLTVCLTDIYDSENKVYINFQKFENEHDLEPYRVWSTITVSYPNSGVELGLYDVKGNGIKTYFSNYYKWGACTSFSFYGEKSDREEMTSLAFDYNAMQVHSLDKPYAGAGATGIYETLVADLIDLNYDNCNIYSTDWKTGYPGFSSPFKGFTTGEVYLSVYAEDKYYLSSEVNFSISEIYGVDLKSDKSYDDKKPLLNINFGGYVKDELPLGLAGTPYKTFNATATDETSKTVKTATSVYYVKGGTRVSDVTVNGEYFTPKKAGTYEILYTADDGAGNVAEESLFVTVVDELRSPAIKSDGDYTAGGKCGDKIVLASVEAESYSGKATITNYIAFKGEVIVRNEDCFVPDEAGEYTVVFVVSDYIGRKSVFSYTVMVERADEPIIHEEPILPYGFIAGSVYSLNDAYATDYSESGTKTVKAEKYIVENGNEIKINDKYTAKAVESGKVTVKYVFSSSSGTSVYEKTLPVITVNNYETDLVKYFVNEKVVKTQSDDAITLKFSGNDEEKFIKAVPLNSSEFSFNVYTENGITLNNANSVTFTFGDIAVNKNVKIRIAKGVENSGKSTLYLNDKISCEITGDFFGSNNNFEFTLNAKSGELKVGSNKLSVTEFSDGTKYDGFTGNKASVAIRVDGYDTAAGKDFAIKIKRFANAYLSKVSEDYIAPEITVFGTLKSKYAAGSVIGTLKASATDFLQENIKTTLTVSLINGLSITDVYSVEGRLLKNVSPEYSYNLALDKAGLYRADYTAEDANGNKNTATVNFTVYDDKIPPTVELSGVKNKYKVGEKVTLPTAKVNDNRSASSGISCYLTVKNPDGIIKMIEFKNATDELTAEYTFDAVGKWVLEWIAVDECDNVQFRSITVTAEG